MEQINSNFYEKYTNLKRRKFSDIEERNQKIVSDVLQYRKASEQLVEDLKNENDKLRVELLSKEEQYRECQKLLLEVNQKAKVLSSEADTAKELVLQKNDNADKPIHSSVYRSPASRLEGECLPGKRNFDTLSGLNATLSAKNSSLTLNDGYNQDRWIPDCCKKAKDDFGDGICKKSSPCAFHMLTELLVGMNFVVDYRTMGPCFSVFHQMSGYSFTLCWERDQDGEGNIAYQVSSLGTIERIALEWMKEDIVFNAAMFPVFFDRLSRVVGKK